MAQKIKYDWKKSVVKGLQVAAFSGLPALIAYYMQANPALAAVTIGSLLTGLSNWLKFKGGTNGGTK
jgi:hypothetical protein